MNDLPYGVWFCPADRLVLFNRFYEPICERIGRQNPTPVDGTEWVEWERQAWFYGDDDREQAKRRKAAAALVRFNAGRLWKRPD